MGVQDDFGQWESELRTAEEVEEEVEEEVREEACGRGVVVCGVLIALGCTVMILVGQVALGVAGLVLSAVIMLLWRAGM